jgi:hypothetical protein
MRLVRADAAQNDGILYAVLLDRAAQGIAHALFIGANVRGHDEVAGILKADESPVDGRQHHDAMLGENMRQIAPPELFSFSI